MAQLSQKETPEGKSSLPHADCTHRLQARREREAQSARLFRIIAWVRTTTFAALTFVAFLGLNDPPARVLLLFPFALFVGLVIWHARVSRACRRAARAANYYERRLACLENRWAGFGSAGARYLDDAHPCALDLDLFGAGSLFQLLSTARTRAGEDTLAAWLRLPAGRDQILERQEAVQELIPRVDLREDLALLGSELPDGVDLDGLTTWGKAPAVLNSVWLPLGAVLLMVLTAAALIGWIISLLPPSYFAAALLLEGGYALWLRARVRTVLADVERRAVDLMLFAGLLRRLEREPFRSAHLSRLRAALDSAGQPPSSRIAQLARLVDWLNSRHNLFFAPVAALLLWSTQMAFAIEAWRRVSGRAIGRWLAAVAEFEALCALAAYAYENPDDPFPELAPEGPCFYAEALGHPLIPKSQSVSNDLSLGGEARVLIVSGSNMSGKSTLLRTVGINAVLALAGAPVRARRLRLSLLVMGATLRIQDSLREGRSRFYTELTRVRQLIEMSRGTPPLLFLLDELFQGTNSHDRRVGAEAVVRTLVANGAIGLITTHDLALTQIADLLAPQAANVHFEDHFENGVMTFDYRMRPGIVRNSNALALMRSVGIEV
jgi:hypothetical protein